MIYRFGQIFGLNQPMHSAVLPHYSNLFILFPGFHYSTIFFKKCTENAFSTRKNERDILIVDFLSCATGWLLPDVQADFPNSVTPL